jgi:hypothetical protein
MVLLYCIERVVKFHIAKNQIQKRVSNNEIQNWAKM